MIKLKDIMDKYGEYTVDEEKLKEILRETKDDNILAIEACKKIVEKYCCAAKFEAGFNSYYKFTFDFMAFNFSISVCMDNILTTYELLNILYRNIDEFILSYFKH